ncbi:MAG: hypothetical protein HS103_02735 [Anaerolineales bacterium]|nr:hypothetical protein [Anaerolineales bacterium]
MRKRKWVLYWALNPVYLAFGVGIVALFTLSGIGIWAWTQNKPAPPIPTVYRAGGVSAPSPIGDAVIPFADALKGGSLAVALPDGTVRRYTPDYPNGLSLAGLRGDQPFVVGGDWVIAPCVTTTAKLCWADNVGMIDSRATEGILPVLSADHKAIYSYLQTGTGYILQRTPLEGSEVESILTVTLPAAPALPDPATGRLLIVDQQTPKSAAFYTVDPNCVGDMACSASAWQIKVVAGVIEGVAWHPSATAIAFSERASGTIYALSTANGAISPLVTGVLGGAWQPAFSLDGTRLAFLRGDGQLGILDVETGRSGLLPILGTRFVWLPPY